MRPRRFPGQDEGWGRWEWGETGAGVPSEGRRVGVPRVWDTGSARLRTVRPDVEVVKS